MFGDAGDAGDDGEEDDRPDQHPHRGDEGGADRFHRGPEDGPSQPTSTPRMIATITQK